MPQNATTPTTTETPDLSAELNEVTEQAEAALTTLDQLGDALNTKLEETFPVYADSPLLQGASILVFFLILASVTSLFLKRVIARLFAKTKTELDDVVLSALTGPVYVTLLSIGFRLALVRVGLEGGAAGIIASLLATAVILSWMFAAMKIANAVLDGLSRTERFGLLRPDTMPLFSNLDTVAVVLAGLYFIVVAWGGNLGGLLALGGVGGLVIGLAAQDTIGNIFAGLFIFADSPYKVGDYINLDSGERGMVTDIGIRSTRLLTRDDVEVTIPNSVIAGAKIVNESGGPHVKYRVRIPVGVAYGSDVDRARAALEEVAANEPLAEKYPAPRVRMRAFGGSSLDFELLCWIAEPELRGKAKDALFVAVYKRFAELDIEIPYSKHDLYIKEMPEGLGAVNGSHPNLSS